MKFILTYEKFKYNNYLYHYTTLNNIINILKDNEFILSESNSVTSKYSYYLSLTRSAIPTVGYAIFKDARIILDKDRIKHNFKLISYDYFDGFYKKDTYYSSSISSDEYEERIVSNKRIINNILKYVISIEIVNTGLKREIEIIEDLCNKLNITINIYKNKKEMFKSKFK